MTVHWRSCLQCWTDEPDWYSYTWYSCSIGALLVRLPSLLQYNESVSSKSMNKNCPDAYHRIGMSFGYSIYWFLCLFTKDAIGVTYPMWRFRHLKIEIVCSPAVRIHGVIPALMASLSTEYNRGSGEHGFVPVGFHCSKLPYLILIFSPCTNLIRVHQARLQ